jgi:radical SAM protein with 4Fe4S-binding SPASM domain
MLMNYFLARRAVLKLLETPSVYQITKDELYELDNESFRFLKTCATEQGCSSKDCGFIDYCVDESLLITERAFLQRPPLIQSPVPSLRYLELQITDACNLRCRHCYIDSASSKELSLEQIRNVLKEFEEMQGLRVLITGGEPLIHSQFDKLNEMLPEFFLRKVLFTNGVMLQKEILKTLKVDEIQVSIDGLESAHDAIRGSGNFKRTLDAVKLALDAGFDVSISTMIHRANLGDFDSMERLFRSMGIKDWTVDVPCMTGRLKKNSELHVSPEEGGKYLGYGYGGGLHASVQGYGCGYHLMAVLADGSIAKCTFYRDQALGTTRGGLREAWAKMQPVRLEDLLCACDYVEVCRGGCRYRAEQLTGKGGKDPFRCTLYGII